MRRRRNPEVIAGRVNGDGSIQTGEGFTVIRQSTGNYVIGFPSSFRLISLIPSVQSGSQFIAGGYSYTPNAAVVQVYTSGWGALDAGFNFIAVGYQQ